MGFINFFFIWYLSGIYYSNFPFISNRLNTSVINVVEIKRLCGYVFIMYSYATHFVTVYSNFRTF